MTQRERPAAGMLADIEAQVSANMATVRASLQPVDGSPEDGALVGLETFVAVALRIMRKTNPSKIRSEAMTEEIRLRISGKGEA